MNNLIEEVKALIPDGEGYNSEYAQTLLRVVEVLSTPLPDDVQWWIDKLGEPSFSDESYQELRGMLQKLSRDLGHCSTTLGQMIQDGIAAEHEKLALQKRIDELTCEHGRGFTEYCEPCGRINGG